MPRDASYGGGIHGFWHNQAASGVLHSDQGDFSSLGKNGTTIRMCAIEKIGIKHWKKVFCSLQNAAMARGVCAMKHPIPEEARKFVFLRDPLERFLSAFMDKRLRSSRESKQRHCEPFPVFENDKLGLTEGLLDSDQTFFEAYVNTVPLKWNLHFFPAKVSHCRCLQVYQSYCH